MSSWLPFVEMGARLLPVVVQWIADLIEGGKTPDEAEAIVRTEIADRRADIAALRHARDEALKRKHGVE